MALSLLSNQQTNEVLFGGAAGGGKSFIGCLWTILMALKYPGTRWLIGRAKLKTLRQTTLKTWFEVANKFCGLRKGENYEYNQSLHEIYLGDSTIILKDLFYYPSDPEFDELGSLEITGAFIDEGSQITSKAKDIVKSRIRYRLEEYNLIPKILITSNPHKGYLYTEFYKPAADGTLPSYRAFVKSLVTDNPHISPHYITSLQQLDKTSQERLLHGNWEYDDDPAKLMDYDNICDIFTNDFILEKAESDNEKKYITADIARFGSDKTTIFVWQGMAVIDMHVVAKGGVDESVELIKSYANAHDIPMSRVCVDEDGVGGGVVDYLRCKGFVNNSTPVKVKAQKQNFVNLKSQCYYKLSELVNAGEVFVSCDDKTIQSQLTEELEIVKQKDMDKDGKLAIIPKEQMKALIGRSPDYADTLMMRCIFLLARKSVRAYA